MGRRFGVVGLGTKHRSWGARTIAKTAELRTLAFGQRGVVPRKYLADKVLALWLPEVCCGWPCLDLDGCTVSRFVLRYRGHVNRHRGR